MVTKLPPDFSEFLKSLAEHRVEYLLIGGYAVGYHGYARFTGDIDYGCARRKRTLSASSGLYESLDLTCRRFVRLSSRNRVE